MSAVESLKLDSSRAATCVKKQPNTNRAGGQRSTVHRQRETSSSTVSVFMIQEVKCEHKNKTSSSEPQSISLQVRPSSSSSSSVQCVYIRNKVNSKSKYRLWHHSTSRVMWHSLGWAAPTLIKVSKLILPINTFKKSFILKLPNHFKVKDSFLKTAEENFQIFCSWLSFFLWTWTSSFVSRVTCFLFRGSSSSPQSVSTNQHEVPPYFCDAWIFKRRHIETTFVLLLEFTL